MPRRRKIWLGSGRIYHAKFARNTYKNAMDLFGRAIKDAEAGHCSKAHDNLTVANHDYGAFFTEHKHAVGTHAQHSFGPRGAPRMKGALREIFGKARRVFAKNCMVK